MVVKVDMKWRVCMDNIIKRKEKRTNKTLLNIKQWQCNMKQLSLTKWFRLNFLLLTFMYVPLTEMRTTWTFSLTLFEKKEKKKAIQRSTRPSSGTL